MKMEKKEFEKHWKNRSQEDMFVFVEIKNAGNILAKSYNYFDKEQTLINLYTGIGNNTVYIGRFLLKSVESVY